MLDADGSDLSYDTAVSRLRERGSLSERGDAVFYTSSEEMDHADGLLDRVRGSRRSDRADSGKSSPSTGASPPSGGLGSRKSSFGSRLKPDGARLTRPGSPQPLQRRSSGRGRAKLEAYDALAANGHASPRSTSPTRSSTRRKQSSSNPPSRNESPNLSEPRKLSQGHEVHTGLHVRHQQQQNGKNGRSGSPASSPAPSTGESAFSKVRDTLKISKAKKKLKKKKGAAYSVDPVEINFPKYQDPFEAQPSYTDSMETTSKAQSHDFRPVSIPHNKPEYCDHCGETAWGLYRQVMKCSSEL